jgi:hypothetical protein
MAGGKREGVVFSHLTGEDQDSLIWFFGKGQCAFERSVFGYQLERADQFTYGSERCGKCHGAGYEKSPEEQIRESLDKLKVWQTEHEDRIKQGKAPMVPDWYQDGTCTACQGCGWLPLKRKFPKQGPVTAKPTQGDQGPVPKEPASDDLERYGFVSDQLRRLDDATVQTLAAFFGSAGVRNEHDKDRGRIFGVYALTPAGKKLLKMAGKSENVTPPLIIETQATLELAQKKPRRAELLQGAREQAEKRLREAEVAWLGCRPRSRRKRGGGARRLATMTDVAAAARETSRLFAVWVEAYGGDEKEEYRCAV